MVGKRRRERESKRESEKVVGVVVVMTGKIERKRVMQQTEREDELRKLGNQREKILKELW